MNKLRIHALSLIIFLRYLKEIKKLKKKVKKLTFKNNLVKLKFTYI